MVDVGVQEAVISAPVSIRIADETAARPVARRLAIRWNATGRTRGGSAGFRAVLRYAGAVAKVRAGRAGLNTARSVAADRPTHWILADRATVAAGVSIGAAVDHAGGAAGMVAGRAGLNTPGSVAGDRPAGWSLADRACVAAGISIGAAINHAGGATGMIAGAATTWSVHYRIGRPINREIEPRITRTAAGGDNPAGGDNAAGGNNAAGGDNTAGSDNAAGGDDPSGSDAATRGDDAASRSTDYLGRVCCCIDGSEGRGAAGARVASCAAKSARSGYARGSGPAPCSASSASGGVASLAVRRLAVAGLAILDTPIAHSVWISR
jgi:hypothetical protein